MGSSPILRKRCFTRIEALKRDCLEIPQLVGLGQVGNEEAEKNRTAMLEAFTSALEVRPPYYTLRLMVLNFDLPAQVFDLLDTTPVSDSTRIPRRIVHVVTYPPSSWNVNPGLDHLSWNSLPQGMWKVRISCVYISLDACLPDCDQRMKGVNYSSFLIRPFPHLEKFLATVCQTGHRPPQRIC